MKPEGTTLEYKRQYTEDIRKTVIAFANTDGGEIFIGISDDGSVYGVEDADAVMLQVSHAMIVAIRPDITMQLVCEAVEMSGRHVVLIRVQRGVSRPYYLASKGLRPEGVYVRIGASTVPASDSTILKLIRETGGDHYESLRSLQQELSFQDANKTFADEGIPFGHEKMRTLGLVGADGAFTNLGLLLSDQCPHTVKAAVFTGTTKRVFQDRTEFSGSLFRQMEDAFRYLSQFNHTRSELAGLKRVDQRSYPPEALREALLNTFVHREYAFASSALVSVFDDRMEMVTMGGLPKGISYGDLRLGISVLRNPRLADVFFRLNLIEAYGTGIPKIMESYFEAACQPTMEVSENAFRMTLPNLNYQEANRNHIEPFQANQTHPEYSHPDHPHADQPTTTHPYANHPQPHVEQPVKVYDVIPLLSEEGSALEVMRTHGVVTRQFIQESLGLSQATTIRLLNRLVQAGDVVKTGKGKNTRYQTIR